MTRPSVDADVRRVIEDERRLLTPQVRRSADDVERLLDPDFFEYGASGRRWDRATVIAALGAEPAEEDSPRASAMRGERLADTIVLVTYLTEERHRRARRSSLWRRGADGSWRLYFHQGTPIPPGTST